MSGNWGAVLSSFLILSAGLVVSDEVFVRYITPQYGSLNGATQLTIFGDNFDTNLNLGAGTSTTEVFLVSSLRQYVCDVHDAESFESLTVCYTRIMEEGTYYVRMKMNGVWLESNQYAGGNTHERFQFRAVFWRTPLVSDVSWHTDEPQKRLHVRGRLFTDVISSSQGVASNGNTAAIVRVWLTSGICSLFDEDTNPYYISLDNDGESNWGEFTCKVESSYVGNQNLFFIVDQDYGRSQYTSITRKVSAANRLYTLQTYAVVSDVHPQMGSIAGGTLLTIIGRYFDDLSEERAKVFVGGMECVVRSVTDIEIKCITPRAPPARFVYPGGRGVKMDIFPGVTDISATLNDGGANAPPLFFDYMRFGPTNDLLSQSEGFFIPSTTARHSFIIQSVDAMQFYFNPDGEDADHAVMIASSASGEVTTPSYELIAGQEYYFRERHIQDFKLGVYVDTTNYTPEQTSSAKTEHQTLNIFSTVDKEVQEITFENWEVEVGVEEEEWRVILNCPSGVCAGILYWFTLFEADTQPLEYGMNIAFVQHAINRLLVSHQEEVEVTGSSSQFYIVFNSGNWPLKVTSSNPTQLQISMNIVQMGTPNLDTFTFMINNQVSHSLAFGASAADVASAALSLFGPICPSAIEIGIGNPIIYYDMEADVDYPIGSRSAEQSFCGSHSLKNPNNLFNDVDDPYILSMYTHVCFFYNGDITNLLQVSYTYTETDATTGNPVIHSQSSRNLWNVGLTDTDGEWRHFCYDLNQKLQQDHPNGESFQVQRVLVLGGSDSGTDLFLDNIFLGTKSPAVEIQEEMMQVVQSAVPNIKLTLVEVVKDSDYKYTLTFNPIECGHNFPLLGFAFASSFFEVSSNHMEYGFGSGLSKIHVKRTGTASPPVGGTFNVRFNDPSFLDLIDLPADIREEVFKANLETLAPVTQADVTRSGSCAGYIWDIHFKLPGGNYPEMIGEASGLTSLPDPAQITVTTLIDGGLYMNPLYGDYLRTAHRFPQVQVYINGIPSHCEGEFQTEGILSCDFSWDELCTPYVTGVSPSQASPGETITITGTGFGFFPLDVKVTIGEDACILDTTSLSDTSIDCTVRNSPAGSHLLSVHVEGKGFAIINAPLNVFEVVGSVSSCSPSIGSVYGCTTIVIAGSGFDSTSEVTIGGNICEVCSVSREEITCMTSAGSAGTFTVDVTTAGQTVTSTGVTFEYTSDGVGSVRSTSLSTLSVRGGETLTIDGTGFGTSQGRVYLGGYCVEDSDVSSWSDTEVIITTPSLPHASYDVKILASESSIGCTATRSVSYTFTVSSISPMIGSLAGGTRVTITGNGLTIDTSVKFGDVTCNVVDWNETGTSLTCVTSSASNSYTITNSGQHPTAGVGYAWSPSTLEVIVGDHVTWAWSVPNLVSGAAIGLMTTSDATSNQYNNNGFQVAPSARGSHTFVVPTSDTFYYGSGCVGSSCDVFMRGVIHSIPASTLTRDLTVSLNGHEASYRSPRPTFTFDAGITPTVTDVSPRRGTTDTTITITGSGFTTTPTVTIGGKRCEVSVPSTTTTLVSCRIPPSERLSVATYHEVVVNVARIGNARNEILNYVDSTFVLLPLVTSVRPNVGSLVGGTTITIQGSGFCDDALFDCSSQTISMDGRNICDVDGTTSDYNTITCVTSSTPSASSGEVVVSVSSTPSTCSENCEFMFTESATPFVTSWTHNRAGDLAITFTGSGFGVALDYVTVSLTSDHISASCTVTEVTDTKIMCTSSEVPVGDNVISIIVEGKGLASFDGTASFNNAPQIDGITPSSGSVEGGTQLTIGGNGFVFGPTSVRIDDVDCAILSVSYSSIICVTGAHTDGTFVVVVTSNNVVYPSTSSYQYSTAATPSVSSIEPQEGTGGNSVTIAGAGFGTFDVDVSVSIGGVECIVLSVIDAAIECELGSREGGAAAIEVLARVKGLATVSASCQFRYSLTISSISPSQGSYGGGQAVEIDGQGFSENSVVRICGNICEVDGSSVAADKLTCTTPANPHLSAGSTACEVEVANGQEVSATPILYQYESTLTPTITSVTPNRGGTGGGTLITIEGTGFPASPVVSIGGSTCDVQSLTVTTTSITCITNSHQGSIMTKVQVATELNTGIATQDGADFFYVDRWSSVFTWGGDSLPVDQDFVIIQEGQTVLLDTDTAVMTMLLIDGGELIFDETDVILCAENILITNGGLLQVGTEEAPFQHNAHIVMYGHLRSPELPIYGAKTLGVRKGTLDLHGRPVTNTWTKLADTASVGATQITLKTSVDGWRVGDKIVIATTGLRHSQSENEERIIASVSTDGLTLTLTEPLEFEHLGVTEIIEEKEVEFRAEVGLLTRNIVFMGSDHPAWREEIPRCDEGFDTGMFATQTCFQGRFGEEVGSDQFGASIMMHSREPSSPFITARIEYTEVTYAGQAFRLGRYPIHWHLMGDVQGMYVRGCSIHNTFNRAVTIHGTHNLLVESNVVYDIMGGAIFIEDGIETGNVIQYNLAVFVRQSTSLLNDDVTPAAFWVTNPDNILRHNHAAGGTHFGFWYRMHEHPDGPSFDSNICQQNVELESFENNTVHSQGWFGLWIFQTYHPMVGGGCDSTQPSPAKFMSLTAWNCEKGAEWVEGGAIQFIDFIMVNNEVTGIDVKLIVGTEWGEENGAMIDNALIVGSTSFSGENPETRVGITLPFAPGLYVRGTHFVNFNRGGVALSVTDITGTCTFACGGFYYWFRDLRFARVSKKALWRWPHEGVLVDLDGSLTGETGQSVVPFTDIMDPNLCIVQEGVEFSSGLTPSAICSPEVRFHRVALKDPIPSSLEGNTLIFSNEYGSASSIYLKKRLTHKPGWMLLLQSKKTYRMQFDDSEPFTNITYEARYYDLMEGDYIFVEHKFAQQPDWIRIGHGETLPIENAIEELTENSDNLDWSFDPTTLVWKFIVSGKALLSRGERSTLEIVDDEYIHVTVVPHIYRCLYEDCIGPVDPGSIPPSSRTPDDAIMWSDPENPCIEGIGTSTVVIKKSAPGIDECWVVVNVDTIIVNSITIEGVLEFHGSAHVSAIYIVVLGGRIIAGFSSTNCYSNDLTITLRGDHDTTAWALPGVELGSKALGCFGGCDFHGKNHDVYWTHLAQTANQGDTYIVLTQQVDWEEDDEIVITTTGYRSEETEKHVIRTISGDRMTIYLVGQLVYRHMGQSYTTGGRQYDMRAEVGLLTRNIRIIGESYPGIDQQAFGARVLVGHLRISDQEDLFGWGSFSNVEFFQTGQEGWTEPWDPRFSLAWLNTGASWVGRPSSVFGCAFHDGFSTAIGTFGASNIIISENVVHRTIHDGIRITGNNMELRHNLVTMTLFRGSYDERFELTNFKDWQASFEVSEAENLIMNGNTAAGSERLCFHMDGESCNAPEDNMWTENVAHGCLHGVQIFKQDGVGSCSMIRNFYIYKAWDYGIYHQTETSVIVRNTIIVDSTVGYMPYIFAPAALSHDYSDKSATMIEVTCVGRSPHFDPLYDFMDESRDKNLRIRASSPSKKAPRTPTGGKTCVMLPMFQSASNGAPFKPFNRNMNYPTIRGLLSITGLHAQSYKSHSDGTRDSVFYTNPDNEDAYHPTYLEGTTYSDVQEESKILFGRPSVGKVNPSDCVDMECDGMKKVMVKDLDGGFLGGIGAVIPQAEFAWDDPNQVERGLGDYRIPKPMLTNTDGARIEVDDIVDGRGIIRSNACIYKDAWQAYDCHGVNALNYVMLVIESMDKDTELRRLSPVALLGNRYIDLNNGPQDHGWCAGYTCQKRISTFYTIVASDNHFDIFFTGYAPRRLRLHLLNVDSSVTVRVAIWYARPERLDVIRVESGLYVHPQDSVYDAINDFWTLQPTTNANQGMYMPAINSGVHGANYMDRRTKLLYVTLRGPEPIEINTVDAVIISFGFPAISVDEFFGEQLVSNLAGLLGVPHYKIRLVEVIRETDSRRKRDTSGGTVTYTIMYSDEIRNTTAANNTAYSAALLNNGSALIVLTHQTGNLSSILGVPITTLSLTQASTNGTEDPANNTDVFYNIPTTLRISSLPSTTEEYIVFAEQPVVTLLDSSGNTVNLLDDVFEVTVSLDTSVPGADAAAHLMGPTSLMFTNGEARFSNLSISHSGTYNLRFQITKPLSTSVSDAIVPVVVSARVVNVGIVGSSDYVMHGEDISVTLELQNSNGELLQNVGYKGHVWKATAALDQPAIFEPAQVNASATITFTFDPTTGRLTTTNLRLSDTLSYRKYNLHFRVYTEPALYDVTSPSLAIPFFGPNDTIAVPTNELEKIRIEVLGVLYRSRTFTSTEVFNSFMNNFVVEQITNTSARVSNLMSSAAASGITIVEFDLSADTAGQLVAAKENLRSGLEENFSDTGLSVASSSCIFEVNNVCYGTTTTMNPTIPVTPGTDTWIYVVIAVVAAILLAAAFIATSCFLKRAQSNKVSASGGCLDASSSRGLTPIGDSFYTGSTAFTPNSDTVPDGYYPSSTRMTPVQT